MILPRDAIVWRRFLRKESLSSEGEIFLSNFVSCTIYAPFSYTDAVEKVAQNSEKPIPIDNLPDFLQQRKFARGASVFGNPGDYFDRVALQFDDVYWYISKKGLRFVLRSPLDDLSPFDRLAGELILAARAKVAARTKLSSSTYLSIAARLDEEGFRPLDLVEGAARKVLAGYNQKNPLKAVHSFAAALQSKNLPVKQATLRRLYRASGKYKRLANS